MAGLKITLLSLLVVGLAVATAERIVGGSVTTITQYPYAAALLFSASGGGTFRQSCGGTILNNRSILSAAHCFYRRSTNQWRARIGSTYANSGGTVFTSSSLINHPSYHSWTIDNDVAIMRVVGELFFNNNVQPASIAGTNYNLGDNQSVWAIGWGTISPSGPPSEQLRHVQIWTVNQSTCVSRYAEIRLTVTDNMLCSGWLDVGGRDQCQGDSGGPLIHNGVIVGVCSWGESCALARYPGVNARVSRFTPWIQATA